MAAPDLKKITKILEKSLEPKRFEHTKGVEYTAAALAMAHGADVKNAQLAGLLHDNAKCYSDDKLRNLCDKYNLGMNDAESKNPALLHAKVGSFMAMETFGVKDSDIVRAVLNHTTGRPDMSLLEKIVFIADYIEPGRKKAARLPEIREAAFKDLNAALLMILEDTLNYLSDSKMEIDPMTQKTYDFYKEKGNRNGESV